MHNAGGQLVCAKAGDGVLKVLVVQAYVCIGACRNGAFLRIEGILPFAGAGHCQPGFRLFRVRGADGQAEAVTQPHKYAAITGRG